MRPKPKGLGYLGFVVGEGLRVWVMSLLVKGWARWVWSCRSLHCASLRSRWQS